MEALNFHALLIFSLITIIPANAKCVPITGTNRTTSPSPSLHASPIPQPVASPKSVPSPPQPVASPKSVPSPPQPVASPKSVPSPPQPVASPKSVPSPQPPSNPQPKSIFPHFPIPQPINADPAIQKICAATDYPQDCISSITPSLKGQTDLFSIVEIAIKAATAHTQAAIAAATKLAATPGMAPDVASAISDCKDSYDDALDNFQKALAALPSHDVGTMNSMLSAAITDFSDNDDFLAGKASSPLLLEFNAKLVKMTSNCLAIVSLIK